MNTYKDTELGRDDNKEVRRCDGVGVIPDKGQPNVASDWAGG
jgi:hypothetical protein